MLLNLKRSTALVGIASIAVVAFLVIVLMRPASLTPTAELSPPATQVASLPNVSEQNELSQAVPALDPNRSQAARRRTAAVTRKPEVRRVEPQLTVPAGHEEVADSFTALNETFDSSPVEEHTAAPIVQSSEALENHGAPDEPRLDQSAFTSPTSPLPAAPQKDHWAAYQSERASTLLAEIRAEGVGLRLNAETLGTFAWNPQISWQSHAFYLDRVKGHINTVGERIAELQQIRHIVLPWQQQAITEVTSHAAQVATSTQAAIVHLRENQNRLFVSEYRDHLTTIASRSGEMKQTVNKHLDYKNAQEKFQQLQDELEL